MRSDMFPASSFGKWETVMIVEEMEGEGVPKSDAALSNEAQVEPLEKKVKFEVSSQRQLFPFSSSFPQTDPTSTLQYPVPTYSSDSLLLLLPVEMPPHTFLCQGLLHHIFFISLLAS